MESAPIVETPVEAPIVEAPVEAVPIEAAPVETPMVEAQIQTEAPAIIEETPAETALEAPAEESAIPEPIAEAAPETIIETPLQTFEVTETHSVETTLEKMLEAPTIETASQVLVEEAHIPAHPLEAPTPGATETDHDANTDTAETDDSNSQ